MISFCWTILSQTTHETHRSELTSWLLVCQVRGFLALDDITVIPSLLWPLHCELRHVNLRYFCQAAKLYESRTTWENSKQPTRLQPTPLLLLNFLLCSLSSDSINIFHSPNGLSFLCMEFVTNCLYLDILIRWLQWKTETADAGDISLLFPLSVEISFCVILT